MNVVAVVAGVAVVLVTLVDAADTLVSTRIRSGRWWPTEVFYRLTWFPWAAFGRRFRSESRRETVLSLFGPASLLVLLALWVIGQILGWSLVWWGLRGSFASPLTGWIDGLYYSGIVYFSVGFGDVLPGTGATRVLALAEAFGGLATMGLVIGFVPSLLGAYQAREARLLRLDAFTAERITPMALLTSYLDERAGGRAALDDFFDDWEEWTAELMQGHASFPMLGLFRSQFVGQHWVTALGLVTDAAIVVLCASDDHRGPALRQYRRSVRAIQAFCERIGVEPVEVDPISFELFEAGYRTQLGTLLHERSVREAYDAMIELRSHFAPWMEALIDALVAPRGFWGLEIERLSSPVLDEPPLP